MWAGENSDIRFEPRTVELELTVAVERGTERSGKIRFWVLDGSAKSSRDMATTQRITLSLEPGLSSDPSRRPLISGSAETDEI
ncbi:hypothetical protein GCM10010532_109730 [Dactylosporangium siamense]|uniref:Trypsin-co-occurring domain-containing protein n=2 Tax=Dactylosporangium siamense TaxID=685454 RepID=A0A919UEM2_9ACTN|nr:hypothetical protein Dsi01nite_106400 [Dactylosporangium siamense]